MKRKGGKSNAYKYNNNNSSSNNKCMFYTLKPYKLLHFFIFELYIERDLTGSPRDSGSFSSNWMFRSGHRWSLSVFKNNIKKIAKK